MAVGICVPGDLNCPGIDSDIGQAFCRQFPGHPHCQPGWAPPPPAPGVCTPGHQEACVGGGRTVEGTGTGGIDPFTQTILAITGIGIGGQLGGVVGAGIGQKITGALIASGGDISALAGSLLPAAAGGLLGTVFEQGLQPDLLPPSQQQVLGIGGLGGGALTPAPYLRSTGELTGALLRSKRINVKKLLANGTSGIAGALLRSIL